MMCAFIFTSLDLTEVLNMHVEDKRMGVQVGVTVLVLVAVMIGLIIAANFIA